MIFTGFYLFLCQFGNIVTGWEKSGLIVTNTFNVGMVKAADMDFLKFTELSNSEACGLINRCRSQGGEVVSYVANKETAEMVASELDYPIWHNDDDVEFTRGDRVLFTRRTGKVIRWILVTL